MNWRAFASSAMLAVLAAGCSPMTQRSESITPPLAARSGAVRIRQFDDLLSTKPSYLPWGIAAGPNRDLWITEETAQYYGPDAVVQVASSGKRLNVFYYGGVKSQGSDLFDITSGPDGALWITDDWNRQILRMTTDGTYKGFPVNALPYAITTGPDGALWFTAVLSGPTPAIGRITTKGKLTFFTAGITAGEYLEDITAGPDGALWFAEFDPGKIGRITTNGVISEYSRGIDSGSEPFSLAVGPDKALWFTEQSGLIGRITTKGSVTQYTSGITPGERPLGIAAGPDQAMWFTESDAYGYEYTAARIGRIAMNGGVTEYGGFNQDSYPTNITLSDKTLWFVETARDELGRVRL